MPTVRALQGVIPKRRKNSSTPLIETTKNMMFFFCYSPMQKFVNFTVARIDSAISDILPIQNLVENMVWTLLNNQPNKRSINQVTMGLLFLHLMHHTDRIRSASSSFDQQLIFQVLKFIDENYRDGQLTDLAAQLGYEIPWLSRAIKRLLGRTYK